MIYNTHHSFLYYKENLGIINDYYQNIVALIKNILDSHSEIHINIAIGEDYHFNNNNRTLIININYEHTLVKRGGRDVPDGTPYGTVHDDNHEPYLVRIANYDHLNHSNIIIDYSNPNIHNVKTVPKYDSFSKKHIYKFIYI